MIDNGVDLGFILTQYQNLGFFEVGSVVWYFRDMDGDQLPDLVIVAALTSQSPYTISGYGLPNQYWLVHSNTGSGFTAIAEEWSVPEGGIYSSGSYRGFTSFNATPNQSNVVGFQAWSVLDMDNSGTVDLVVTGETMNAGASVTSVFGTEDPRFWKVFLNPYAIGLDEHIAHRSTLKAYPNPTNSTVAVISTGARPLGTVVFNSLGAVVGSSGNSTLDLSALGSGMYTLRVSLADRTVEYLRIIRQ